MTNVKVACISDTHNFHHNIKGGIPKCDLLLHAGDITRVGNYEKLSKFDDWAGTLWMPQDRMVCIAGNHDLTLEDDPETAKAILSHWTYLQDEAHEVFGLKIWGTPWSKEYGEGWGFQLRTPEERRKCWAKIPDDTDIVVCHEPPYLYGDYVVTKNRKEHVGCEFLAERLMEVRPMLTVCGHVHEDPGVFAAPWGTVVNATSTSGGYKPKRKPIVVNLRIPS